MAETLAIGLCGALVFQWTALPGGLISGAMIAVAAAAIAGRPMNLPPVLAHTILVTLGVSLGSMVTPALLANMSTYPGSIALLALSTFLATIGSSIYLERVHAWDRTSAWLAGTPGALSQIMALAAERNADVPGVAVVQTIRIIILTAALPIALAAMGMPVAGGPMIGEPASWPVLAVLGLAAVATAMALRWLRFPASWMFGAMLASSVLHGAGLVTGGLPSWGYAAALIGIGTLIGTRFAKVTPRMLLRYLAAAFGSFAVAITISAALAALVITTTTIKASDVVIAYAPGAMDAMLALALTLNIDPVFVGAHHLARFFFVSITTPGIVHWIGRTADDVDD